MNKGLISAEICQRMREDGFPTVVLSIERLHELREDFLRPMNEGKVDPAFYDEIVKRYNLFWDFDPSLDGSPIRSIILAAAPQPKVRMVFQHAGVAFEVIIPPTYLHDSDIQIAKKLTEHLLESDYRAVKALLPEKFIAVRSSLAKYGKNNVAYIEGLGSYFRPQVFLSDMPCDSDDWREVRVMKRCDHCDACAACCPTGAIDTERFLIHAERCLTFFNEGKVAFPDWIEASWHNSIIGCMVCQDVCPVNKDHKKWIVEGARFSEEETTLLLDGGPREEISAQVAEKLTKLYLFDDYSLLQRNLRVVMPT